MRHIGLKMSVDKLFLDLADRFRLPIFTIQAMKAKWFIVTSNLKFIKNMSGS